MGPRISRAGEMPKPFRRFVLELKNELKLSGGHLRLFGLKASRQPVGSHGFSMSAGF
jgi:hypothetical protein